MHPPPDNESWHEWRRKIDDRLETGDRRFEANEKTAAERYKKAGERHRELLAAIEGIRSKDKRTRSLPEYRDDDEDEISGVTDVEELQRKARRQRQTAQRWKKYGKAAAPIIGGLSIAFWEVLKAWVLK